MLCRAVLGALPPGGGVPRAEALLDVARREVRTFAEADLAELAGALEGFDVLAALDVRLTLVGMRLDPDRWRLADLSPPLKTWRLNPRS